MDILTKIKVATSFDDNLLSRALDDIKSIRSKSSSVDTTDDAVEYLLSVATFILGTGFLTEIINKLLSSLLERNSSGKIIIEKQIKSFILKTLTKNIGDKAIPSDFITSGYTVPVGVLDIFDLFKIDPNTKTGSAFYGNNSFNLNFFKKILQTNSSTNFINLKELPSTAFNYNILLNVVNVKANSSFPGKTISSYFSSIINSTDFVIIDSSRLIADIINLLFNYLGESKTNRALYNDEQLNQLIIKITENNDIENIYSFNPKQLNKIDEITNKRKKGGYILDSSCELERVDIDINSIESVTSTNNYSEILMKTLDSNLALNNVNKNDSIADNYSKNIIQSIIKVFLHHTVFSPNVWLLFVLGEIFKTGYPKSKYPAMIASRLNNISILDVFKGNESVVTDITNNIYTTALTFLTEIIMKEIIKMVTPFLLKISKEKSENYLNIIETLI